MTGQKGGVLLNRKDTASFFGITPEGFDKWRVQPRKKAGRERMYSGIDVLKNRKEAQTRADQKLTASSKPADLGVFDQGIPIVEKMLLDKSKRIGQELQNEIKLGNLIPTELARYVLAKVGAEIGAILDGLPSLIKRRAPKLTGTVTNQIKTEIVRTRNIAAEVHERVDEFIEEYYSETEA